MLSLSVQITTLITIMVLDLEEVCVPGRVDNSTSTIMDNATKTLNYTSTSYNKQEKDEKMS